MHITHSKQFEKRYKKLSEKMKVQVRKRIALFAKNPFDPILENHPLRGKYSGFRSINITGDFRCVYEPLEDDLARLALLGTHDELYGK